MSESTEVETDGDSPAADLHEPIPGLGGASLAEMTGEKPVVYTAIPKFLTYGNLTIGTFVERQGYAVTTPWQYSYGMGGQVEYEDLKRSLNRLTVHADEVWVFAEKAGVFPAHEHAVHHGLGIMDGVDREIRLAHASGVPVRYFHFDAESMEITPAGEGPPELETDGGRNADAWCSKDVPAELMNLARSALDESRRFQSLADQNGEERGSEAAFAVYQSRADALNDVAGLIRRTALWLDGERERPPELAHGEALDSSTEGFTGVPWRGEGSDD